MSFFGKLKGAILGKQGKNTANIFITDKRYIPTYTIEDWQPKIKMPEYDPLFSLNKYLESIDLPRQTVQKVMSSKNPFGEAKNLFNGQTEKVDWSDMCWRETVRMERWIKVLSLWEAPTERILESTFMYLLLRLGWECHWDTLKQRALNPDGLNYALEACKNNDYSKLLKIVDSDILSCFALAHIRSGRNLTEIVDSCFIYLDMNTTHSIGKISITIFDIKDTTQINIAVKDGQLRIIKIEYSDKKTYMQTLYNYNSK